MDTIEAPTDRIRWLRAFVAGLLGEVILTIAAIPIFTTMTDPGPTLNALVPPLSLVAFIAAGYWSARPVPGVGVMQGALSGAMAVLIYLAIGLVAWGLVPDADVAQGLTAAYLISHALKVIGGAVGGWLAARKAKSEPAA